MYLKNQKYYLEQFFQLLSFKTISLEGPNGSYQACANWINDFCLKLGLQSQIITPVIGKPIVFARWQGTADKKHILLNSHYDVVPVELNHWNTDPFQPQIIDGKIYARGTQDMKCVVMQYLLSIERLINLGFKPQRTIDLSFVPDEEIGGVDGIVQLIESQLFDSQIYEIAFDEGLANESNSFSVFYGERTPFWFTVTAKGNVGHGSQFIDNTAVQKLVNLINKALQFRKDQEKSLNFTHDGCKHAQAKKLGDVTTINLTMLNAGYQNNGNYNLNVIPSIAKAGFDLRITPQMKMQDMIKILDDWCSEEGVTWENYIHSKDSFHKITQTQDNKFYDKLCEVVQSFGIQVEKEIFPAATDSRFLREIKIPAFGFSPMRNQQILLHQHNEYIKQEVFFEGIDIYEKLILELSQI